MGERTMENRVRKLREIGAQQKELAAHAEAIRAEIKADMESKGLDEMAVKNFII